MMPSILKNLIRDASPVITEAFGERDGQGDFVIVEIKEPGNSEPIQLLGVTVGRLSVSDEVVDERGSYSIDQIEDSVVLYIPRQQIKLSKLYEPRIESKVKLAFYPGESFVISEIVSLTDSRAQVRCTRKHVTKLGRTGSEQ